MCLVSWMSEKIGVAKFDTGAVHTILTPDVICGRSLSSVELSNIKYYLEKKHSDVSVELESAFGQKLKCYLSCLHDVSIEDITLKDFYFFLVPQENSKFLLGDDFISKTAFRHEINSNITLTEFDYDGYCRYFKSYVNKLQNSVDVSVLTENEISWMLSFNKEDYLKEYLNILPPAAVAECNTKEDCDTLLSSVELTLPRG